MDRLKELTIDRTEKGKGKKPGRSSTGFTIWVLSALMFAVAVAAAWWWSRNAGVIEVRTARVQESVTSAGPQAVLDASGYVAARRRSTVSSKITGKLTEVLVDEGAVVDEGQLLARLDDSTQTRQLALAEAQLSTAEQALAEIEVRLVKARLDLERSRQMVAEEIASQEELDRSGTEHDTLVARLAAGRDSVTVAQRRLSLRRQELEDTEIRAPFAGVAVTKNAQPGEMISPVSAGGGFTRTGICTLVDMSSLEIEVDVNEAYIDRVRSDQGVTAILDAYPGWQIPASVITTVPTADRQKATVKVRVAFDELDPRILPDMGVRVSFLSDEPETDDDSEGPRLTIPAAAVHRDGDRDVVYVVHGEVVERRAVRLAEPGSDDGRREVEAGLARGDQVVIEAGGELVDGLRVRAVG